MNNNEQQMKEKGESKVWNSILKANGKAKDISSTQLGQQILLEEALRIQPEFEAWVEKSYEGDRLALRNTF